MNTSRASRLIRCPECGDTHLSFLETRRSTVYYRQVPGAAPLHKTARVLVEESGGSLYEEETETGYAEDIQGYCHSCGSKWKTPDCTSMDDLLMREESAVGEAEPLLPEESPYAEAPLPQEASEEAPDAGALFPEEVPEEAPDAGALFPEETPDIGALFPAEAAEPEPPAPEPLPEPEPPPPPPPERVPERPKAPPPRKARKIKAADLAKDIVAGVADPELMSKYNITASQLEALLQRLVDKGVITQQQIDARVNLADTSITKAFVETQRSMQELDYAETQSVDPLEALAVVKKEITPQPPPPPPPQPAKPKIKAKQFVKDVESRMSDPQLMQKYSLDEKQLNSLFQRLVDLGMLKVELLYNRTSISDTSITKAFVEVYQSLEELEE